MRGTIVGSVLAMALGLLAAGANFGCSQNAAVSSGSSMPPVGAASSTATVNNLCPITGTPIDPNNVPDSKVRYYKGMKVGFCCGGHPEIWDKLSDAEKDAKLAAVMTPPQSSTGSASGNTQNATSGSDNKKPG